MKDIARACYPLLLLMPAVPSGMYVEFKEPTRRMYCELKFALIAGILSWILLVLHLVCLCDRDSERLVSQLLEPTVHLSSL